jgi:hypothetical protein
LTTNEFYDQVLTTIVSLRAPFRAVEDREWKKLAVMQNPRFPLPSATTIRTRLAERVIAIEEGMLRDVVPGSKVAISLDGWSSTTRVSFIGIVAHYIDKDWNVREELIGFEHMPIAHTGKDLAVLVNKVFAKYDLEGQIVAITTDNARPNYIMMDSINRALEEALSNSRLLGGKIYHMPCLAHVIQLGLQALLGKIRLRPTNEVFIRNFMDDKEKDDLTKIAVASKRGIPYILAKVRGRDFILIFILISYRFEN